MRRSRTALLVTAALLIGLGPTVRAAAPLPVARLPHDLVVTGHEQALGSYLRQGATLREAAVLAQLDHFAARGADKAMLTFALRAGQRAADGGDAGPKVMVGLFPIGDLDGGAVDVLEIRETFGKEHTTRFVARDGATGRVLWQRLVQGDKGFVFALPAKVGRPARPGLLLVRDSLFDEGTSIEALDRAGRSLWKRAFAGSPSQAPENNGLLGGWVWEIGITMYDVDLALRPGGPEVLVTQEHWTEDDSTPRPTHTGDLTYTAVDVARGNGRTIGSRVTADGWVRGYLAGDQDGDGFTDLTLAVAGSKPRLAVVRGKDGSTVWNRTDVPTYGFAVLWPATPGVAPGTPDLLLFVGRNPGLVGPINTPGVPFDPTGLTGGQLTDPTAAAHGTVALLARRTGRTIWTRAGDDATAVDLRGRSRVLVTTDESSSTLTEFIVSAKLELVGRDGRTAWTTTRTDTVPRDPGETGQTFVASYPLVDVDGDGLLEADLSRYLFTSSWDFYFWDSLVGSATGGLLHDQRSGFLWGSLDRSGSDRVALDVTPSGTRLRVLRGRDGRQVFAAVVPGSKGGLNGWAVASQPRCAAILFAGVSKERTDIAVLDDQGRALWWVAGAATAKAPASPARGPGRAASC